VKDHLDSNICKYKKCGFSSQEKPQHINAFTIF